MKRRSAFVLASTIVGFVIVMMVAISVLHGVQAALTGLEKAQKIEDAWQEAKRAAFKQPLSNAQYDVRESVSEQNLTGTYKFNKRLISVYDNKNNCLVSLLLYEQ